MNRISDAILSPRGRTVEVNDSRTDCTLSIGGWNATGLAHVIEVAYSGRIRFCNFVMQITTDQLDGAPNVDVRTPAGLVLEDGRRAAVTVSHFQLVANYFELAGTGNFFD
jgi:hypothetical protein